MNFSSFLFGLIFAVLLGALFHLWKDGGFWRLVLYLSLSVVGTVVGHLMAENSNFSFLTIGTLRLGGALIGSIIFLFVGHWLSLVDIKPKNRV